MAIGDPFPFEKRGAKVVKSAKRVKREDQQQLAPVTRVVPITRIKKKPRGRSFEPGNGFGSEHRFKKGQPSANPSGRPLCKEISKALRERLASDKPIPAKTGAEKIAKQWYEQSLDGNIAAIVSLADRCEGRPSITVTGDGGQDKIMLLIEGMTNRSREIGHPEGWIAPLELEAGDGDEDEATSDE
jgi:hypothetical protein